MNRSPEELELLEEKIARIRKNNEAIIKRKQIIEEEIKEAKLRNAVVNTNRSYDETDDAPTLYADSVEENRTRKLTDIVYPKVQQEKQKIVSRNESDEEAWRRERRQIDSERIRRQKADSGWKREWDANKVAENDGEIDWRSNRDDSSKFNRHDGDADWRTNRNAGSKFSRDDGGTDWRSDRNNSSKFSRDEDTDWRSDRNNSSKFSRDEDTDWRSDRNNSSKFSRDEDTDWRSNRNNSSKFSRDEDTDWRSNRENSLKFNSRKFNDEKFEDNSSTFAGRTFNNKKLESPRSDHFNVARKASYETESWNTDTSTNPQPTWRTPDPEPTRNANISNSWGNADKPSRSDFDNQGTKNMAKTKDRLGQRKRDDVVADQSNNNANKIRSTSGPLLQNKNVVPDNVMVISNCRVTKFSDTKAQPPQPISNRVSWRRGDKFDLEKENLNERLKNMVIRVKTEENKPSERVVEVVDEPKSSRAEDRNVESGKGANSSLDTVTFEETGTNTVRSESASVPLTFNIQNTERCSSMSKTSNVTVWPVKSCQVVDTSVKSKSPPVGILKNSSHVLPPGTTTTFDKKKLPSKKDKKVTTVDVNDDDDEWEDVSDDEWEDVTEEE